MLNQLDRDLIKKEFTQAFETYQGQKLTYLDSAATSLKPQSVVNTIKEYYLHECANVHRGIHTLSEVSSTKFEHTRELLKNFIGATSLEEIIFTGGTTDSINLIARSYGDTYIHAGDEILISHMEHHSNIVPWQMLCERTKAVLKIIPINDDGEILLEEYQKLLNPKTKLVSISMVSNTLGTINPVKEMIRMAKTNGAIVVLDGAQALSHMPVDVIDLNCDFLAGSAHKMFGPTGVGFLFGKKELLENMPPITGGGAMIEKVSFSGTTYNKLPFKFEAGTPHIAGVIGFGKAIELITSLGLQNIHDYEDELTKYATQKLTTIPGLKIIGTAQNKISVISFVIKDIHAYDVSTLLNKDGVAVRSGHHCTDPLMERMQVPATSRASFSVYTQKEDIDKLYNSLLKIINLFS